MQLHHAQRVHFGSICRGPPHAILGQRIYDQKIPLVLQALLPMEEGTIGIEHFKDRKST